MIFIKSWKSANSVHFISFPVNHVSTFIITWYPYVEENCILEQWYHFCTLYTLQLYGPVLRFSDVHASNEYDIIMEVHPQEQQAQFFKKRVGKQDAWLPKQDL